jgi:hypothetical protein
LHGGAALPEHRGGGLHRLRQQLAQVDIVGVPLAMARFDLGHVQHLVHQAAQTLGLGQHDVQERFALRRRHLGVVAHQLGDRANRGQRRAQLVGHGGHEVVLQPVQAQELRVGGAQLAGRAFQRCDLSSSARE